LHMFCDAAGTPDRRRMAADRTLGG
jgi:hypothetical protein